MTAGREGGEEEKTQVEKRNLASDIAWKGFLMPECLNLGEIFSFQIDFYLIRLCFNKSIS